MALIIGTCLNTLCNPAILSSQLEKKVLCPVIQNVTIFGTLCIVQITFFNETIIEGCWDQGQSDPGHSQEPGNLCPPLGFWQVSSSQVGCCWLYSWCSCWWEICPSLGLWQVSSCQICWCCCCWLCYFLLLVFLLVKTSVHHWDSDKCPAVKYMLMLLKTLPPWKNSEQISYSWISLLRSSIDRLKGEPEVQTFLTKTYYCRQYDYHPHYRFYHHDP